MPSENYHNQSLAPAPTGETPPNFRQRVGNAASRTPGQAIAAYNQMSPRYQKEAQRKLKNLQKSAPNLAKNLAKKKPSALVGLAGNMLRRIDWTIDWMFIPFLASFALLKDIFDIVFGGVGAVASGIPVVGQAAMGVGIIVSFVGERFLLIFAVVVLFLP